MSADEKSLFGKMKRSVDIGKYYTWRAAPPQVKAGKHPHSTTHLFPPIRLLNKRLKQKERRRGGVFWECADASALSFSAAKGPRIQILGSKNL